MFSSTIAESVVIFWPPDGIQACGGAPKMAAFGKPELLVELTIAVLGELNVLDCALIWEARLEAASAGS